MDTDTGSITQAAFSVLDLIKELVHVEGIYQRGLYLLPMAANQESASEKLERARIQRDECLANLRAIGVDMEAVAGNMGAQEAPAEELVTDTPPHPITFAPGDPNEGRECGLCGHSIPQGTRYVHADWCDGRKLRVNNKLMSQLVRNTRPTADGQELDLSIFPYHRDYIVISTNRWNALVHRATGKVELSEVGTLGFVDVATVAVGNEARMLTNAYGHIIDCLLRNKFKNQQQAS